MEDVGGIVVEGEDRPVGIPSVAHIPLLHLAAGRVDTELIIAPAVGGLGEEALDDRREEEPVGVGRVDGAQALELFDVALLRRLVEGHPQCVPRPEERLGDVGGVDEVLPRLAPAEIVGRGGIDAVSVGGEGPLPELSALLPLRRIVVGKGEPGCDAGHQPSEGLHVDHGAVAVVERGRELRQHVLLQFAL